LKVNHYRGFRIQDSGYRIQDSGKCGGGVCPIPAGKDRNQDTGFRIRGTALVVFPWFLRGGQDSGFRGVRGCFFLNPESCLTNGLKGRPTREKTWGQRASGC
jgi:hypothetical protein